MEICNKIKKKTFERKFDISDDDLVLEIGSGHNPYSRSDVLLDKYIVDDTQRGGKIKSNEKPLICADAEKLPFKRNTFDFIIASHVIEHVDDPRQALEEMMRVGKRGYIESPSFFLELLHPKREYHKWWILQVNNKLLFKKKPEKTAEISTLVFGDIFNSSGFLSKSVPYQIFFREYEDFFRVKYTWEDKIEYVIEPEEEKWKKFFEKPYLQGENKFREMVENRKKTVWKVLLEITYGKLRGLIR